MVRLSPMAQLSLMLKAPAVAFRGFVGDPSGGNAIDRLIGFIIGTLFAVLFFILELIGDPCESVVIRVLQFVVLGLGLTMLTARGAAIRR